MEITRTIIGTYAEITSLAEDSSNKKIGFKWYEPHPNGLEGYFYAILRVESIKGTILEKPQISVEELKDFSYGSSITKPISLVEQRKRYNKLLYQFIDEQKAYIEAELKEIALKNGLNFGRSTIETASGERFLLAEMHVQIANNSHYMLDNDHFRLFGYPIGKGKNCRINRDKCCPIPSLFTYLSGIGTEEHQFKDYQIDLYGKFSIKKYANLDVFKQSLIA